MKCTQLIITKYKIDFNYFAYQKNKLFDIYFDTIDTSCD